MTKWQYLPHVKEYKEHESPLGEFRVAKGLTVDELAEKCNTVIGVIGRLQNGMMTPYYLRDNKSKGTRRGDVRIEVETMSEVLRASIAELFPRYICDIERYDRPRERVPFVESQLEDFSVNFQYANIRNSDRKFEVFEIFEKAMDEALSPREKDVLIGRFYKDLTLDEVGCGLAVSGERVRQVEKTALRRLRAFFNKHRGKGLREELEEYYPQIKK
jgi:RNA polymerase sigma factor (sigma-70 family)